MQILMQAQHIHVIIVDCLSHRRGEEVDPPLVQVVSFFSCLLVVIFIQTCECPFCLHCCLRTPSVHHCSTFKCNVIAWTEESNLGKQTALVSSVHCDGCQLTKKHQQTAQLVSHRHDCRIHTHALCYNVD